MKICTSSCPDTKRLTLWQRKLDPTLCVRQCKSPLYLFLVCCPLSIIMLKHSSPNPSSGRPPSDDTPDVLPAPHCGAFYCRYRFRSLWSPSWNLIRPARRSPAVKPVQEPPSLSGTHPTLHSVNHTFYAFKIPRHECLPGLPHRSQRVPTPLPWVNHLWFRIACMVETHGMITCSPITGNGDNIAPNIFWSACHLITLCRRLPYE